MTDRELMQQALDALEKTKPKISEGSLDVLTHDAAITALRDRLAQSKQEPVVLMDAPLLLNGQPLYTHPPQRQWVGLTDEEIRSLNNWWPSYNDKRSLMVLIRDAEAKLKEKNT